MPIRLYVALGKGLNYILPGDESAGRQIMGGIWWFILVCPHNHADGQLFAVFFSGSINTGRLLYRAFVGYALPFVVDGRPKTDRAGA